MVKHPLVAAMNAQGFYTTAHSGDGLRHFMYNDRLGVGATLDLERPEGGAGVELSIMLPYGVISYTPLDASFIGCPAFTCGVTRLSAMRTVLGNNSHELDLPEHF